MAQLLAGMQYVRKRSIPNFIQFGATTALFSPVKVHKCVNSQQNSQKQAKISHSLCKKGHCLEKYTTAGCGGCDKYQLWWPLSMVTSPVRYIDMTYRLSIYRHFWKISISISIRQFWKISISISISIRQFQKYWYRYRYRYGGFGKYRYR